MLNMPGIPLVDWGTPEVVPARQRNRQRRPASRTLWSHITILNHDLKNHSTSFSQPFEKNITYRQYTNLKGLKDSFPFSFKELHPACGFRQTGGRPKLRSVSVQLRAPSLPASRLWRWRLPHLHPHIRSRLRTSRCNRNQPAASVWMKR